MSEPKLFKRVKAEAYARAASEVANDVVITDAPSNRQMGWEAVGGWLVLTTTRLVFVSHSYNHHEGLLSITLSDILSVKACWTRLFNIIPIAPNSIAVIMRSGQEYRFVVDFRHQWAATVNQHLVA